MKHPPNPSSFTNLFFGKQLAQKFDFGEQLLKFLPLIFDEKSSKQVVACSSSDQISLGTANLNPFLMQTLAKDCLKIKFEPFFLGPWIFAHFSLAWIGELAKIREGWSVIALQDPISRLENLDNQDRPNGKLILTKRIRMYRFTMCTKTRSQKKNGVEYKHEWATDTWDEVWQVLVDF